MRQNKDSRLSQKSRQAAIMTAHYLRGRGVLIVNTYVRVHAACFPLDSVLSLRSFNHEFTRF